MGIDFGALDTSTAIRQALDVLQQVAEFVGYDYDGPTPLAALAAVRAGVKELEHRLNTARRTAWVAVPIAWSEVMAGDVIVAKNGTLMLVQGKGRDVDREDAPADLVTWDVDHGPRSLRSNDPDRPVPVLRRPTADALDILSRQLGAQVMTK